MVVSVFIWAGRLAIWLTEPLSRFESQPNVSTWQQRWKDVRGSTKSGSPGIDYTHAGLPPAVIHARFDARFPELKVLVDFEQA